MLDLIEIDRANPAEAKSKEKCLAIAQRLLAAWRWTSMFDIPSEERTIQTLAAAVRDAIDQGKPEIALN